MTTVAILGATDKEERYAFMAQQRLMNAGYTVLPVSLAGKTILGVTGFKSIGELPRQVDTVTLYVNPTVLTGYMDDLVRLHPRRVIFNPGTESPALMQQLRDAGIHVVEACTLVLLSTHQFEVA